MLFKVFFLVWNTLFFLNRHKACADHMKLQTPIENTTFIRACDHSIFCHGEILQKIQLAGIYDDSKTFVDMALKVNFTEQVKADIMQQTKDELRKVVEKYFEKPGKELESVNITESPEQPKFLKNIKDKEYRQWAVHLCSIWKRLVRKINPEVQQNPERYSFLYMKNAFVVPGGRFREMYYWDTYWSIDGLLICEMYKTVKYILENLLEIVQESGFVPNGFRKYYMNRSQPPFLTLMVEKYWSVTKDNDFVKKYLPTLIKEHEFWMKQRAVNVTSHTGKVYTLNRYNSLLGEPRPESYREDVELVKKAEKYNNQTAAMEMYSHIASAAESGWDFSSRWFRQQNNMTTIHTRDIIPVDLNAILCMVEFAIAKFSENTNIMNNATTAKYYKTLATGRREAIDTILWHPTREIWLDYDLSTKSLNKHFYLSSVFPLWSYTMDSTNWNQTKSVKAYNTLRSLGIFDHDGGAPTSLSNSGEQWDFPNAWPPLQYVLVHGLNQVNIHDIEDEAEITGEIMAKKYLETAYLTWKTTGYMYEKYDVTSKSQPGRGGEYKVQEGFGWTNGVALNFLKIYGNQFDAPKGTDSSACMVEVGTLFQTIAIFVMTYFLILD